MPVRRPAPALTARVASQWGVVLGELFASGASSVVMRCRWRDGTLAVLKLSPDRAVLTKQVEMLRVFAPSGRVTAVLSADTEAGAVVLEEILRGRATRPSPGSAGGCPNRPSARGSTSPRGSGRYSAVRRLLDTQASIVLLHGDLHLGNVLDGGPSRGLVAIDPKACLGDPCFDAVDYVVVIASMVAVAHLTYDGPEPAIDELLALAR